MSDLDKTYCDKTYCKNKDCDRHQCHIYNESKKYEIWIGVFPNCPNYKKGDDDNE